MAARGDVASGTYDAYNRTSGLNLEPSAAGTANGTAVAQWSFGGSTYTTQQWRLNALGNGQYSMLNAHNGRAVTINSGSISNNAPVQIWDYTGATDQKITMTSRGSGFYSLAFVHSGKAMHVNGASTASGAAIIQFDDNGSWDSQWQLHLASSRIVPQDGTSWMAHYLKNQNATKSTHYNLIFDGDSITDFWKSTGLSVWNANWAPKGAYDYGVSGDRTEHLWWRLLEGEADTTNPKLVVLLIGTNNLADDDAPTIASKITAIVNDYLTHCPNAHILLLGILPRGQLPSHPFRAKIVDVNSRISSLNGTGGGRVVYKDIGSNFLQPDGTISSSILSDYLHPTAQGYQIFANAIKSTVDTYVP